jgi:hypothetical protein
MSRSNKKTRHHLDDPKALYKGIRKPIPKKGGPMKDRTEKRKQKFNWRDEIDDN